MHAASRSGCKAGIDSTRTSGFDDGERSVTRGLPFGVQSHGRFSV